MSAGRYVLIVDDDAAIAETLSDLLAMEGYETALALNGRAALDECQRRRPDVILLDMRMPVMDGWQFARTYRMSDQYPAPIVCVTAARDASVWAREIGAEAHVAKPFDVDELISTLERVLRHAPSRAA